MRISFYFILILLLSSCGNNKDNNRLENNHKVVTVITYTLSDSQHIDKIYEIEIDGCQYIGTLPSFTHKGNCNNYLHRMKK